MNLSEYFKRFWADDAVFDMKVFGNQIGFWDIDMSPWQDGVKLLKQVVPVKGVPFCSKTRMVIKNTILE
jgi:hypothetical protein